MEALINWAAIYQYICFGSPWFKPNSAFFYHLFVVFFLSFSDKWVLSNILNLEWTTNGAVLACSLDPERKKESMEKYFGPTLPHDQNWSCTQ